MIYTCKGYTTMTTITLFDEPNSKKFIKLLYIYATILKLNTRVDNHKYHREDLKNSSFSIHLKILELDFFQSSHLICYSGKLCYLMNISYTFIWAAFITVFLIPFQTNLGIVISCLYLYGNQKIKTCVWPFSIFLSTVK